MYCGNCGTKNDDTAAFCQACGSPLTAAPGANAGAAAMSQRQADRKKGIIAVVAAVVVIALVGWLLFGGRGYKATVEKFFEACMDGDVQGVLELIPNDVIESTMESQGFDKGDMQNFVNQAENELKGMLAIGGAIAGNMDLNIDITGEDDITGEQLKTLQTEYKDKYNVKVKEAKTVNVNVSLDSGILSGAQDLEIPVIKVGRSWYLDVNSL
ncbi:zinc ribbon domain-containing protein [Agathobaculum sp. LCP25S3_E8]|uniref:zinc ribbon domain-containing protein n=1 Tax=Agathobaculum sp. LCP25S3_E8 TaxID=3438735 RepID=UPI003F931245